MGWKLATFNVNGVRARLPLVLDWLKQHQPDVLCLQEIKCPDEDFPAEPFLEAGYKIRVRGQKSFNGVALITKTEPAAERRGFNDSQPDDEARLIAGLVDGVWVVNTYVPQGRHPDDPAFKDKLNFLGRLKDWFAGRFDLTQPLIWVGDINVAPQAIDVFDARRLEGEVVFHPAERRALKEVADLGFSDLFRRLHPEQKQFTFWDYRLPQSFKRNLGWRLDLIMATRPAAEAAIFCAVDPEPRAQPKPSDHTPVWAEFDRGRL